MNAPAYLYEQDSRDWDQDLATGLIVIEAERPEEELYTIEAEQRNPWAWLWAAWFALFALLETVALLTRKKGVTLTATLRRWLALTPEAKETDKHWKLKRLAFLAFMSWLAGHFLLKGVGYF